MYPTISVVELIPPLTSHRHRPVLFSSPPVAVVSFSPPVVKFFSRSREATQFTHAHVQFTHAQLTAHEEHPQSRATAPPQPSVPTVPRILFSTYLRRPLRYSHRPSHNTHLENLSFDSQTVRSFYNKTLGA